MTRYGDHDPFDDLVELPIEERIDLHTFRPREVLDLVDAYLDAALEAGFRDVCLIHGKGKGVQRSQVRALLRQDLRVEHFANAPPEQGGWGATVVRLREPTD